MNITAEQAERSHKDKANLTLGVSVGLTVLGFLVVTLRLWCRRLMRSLGWDDLAAVLALAGLIGCGVSIAAMTRYGLGRHEWTLSPNQLKLYGRCFWLSVLFYTTSLYWSKMAFLLQYHRIMNVSRIRWIYLASIIIVTLWGLVCFIGILTQCIPIEAVWDPTIKGKCFKNQTVMWYISAILHIVIDFAIIIMPLPIVWRLKLPLSQKILLSGIFALGFFTIAISIFRLQWLTPSKDVTWWNVTAASWSLAELVSGIMCACLPTYKPLLAKMKGCITHLGKGDSTVGLQGRGTDGSDRNLVMASDDAPFGRGPKIPCSTHTFGTQTSITACGKAQHEAEATGEPRKYSRTGVTRGGEC